MYPGVWHISSVIETATRSYRQVREQARLPTEELDPDRSTVRKWNDLFEIFLRNEEDEEITKRYRGLSQRIRRLARRQGLVAKRRKGLWWFAEYNIDPATVAVTDPAAVAELEALGAPL
jgi:hypothetical protein